MAETPLSPQTRRLIRLLRMAGERARRTILHPPGGTDSAREFAASRAAQQLAQIRRELAALVAAIPRVVGAEIGRAYRAGLVTADRMARQAGVREGPIGGSFTQLDTRRAEVLLRQTTSDLTTAANSIGRVAERTLRQTHALGLNDQTVNRLLAGGTIEGVPAQTLRELRQRLRRIAQGGLVEVVNPRSGVVTTFKPDYYADLVFQTKTREATTIATAGRLEESGIDLVRIIGSNSANFCTAFVGKVFSLSGNHPEYPPLASLPGGGPPFHPRCSKTIVAFVEELASDEQLARSRPDDAVRELMGATPAVAQRAYRQMS